LFISIFRTNLLVGESLAYFYF